MVASMYDEQSHPLLAQVPLTVSPFVSLPTATTLPYTYKSLPSKLPPSSTDPLNSVASNGQQESSKPKYVVSASGHAAHPDDIIASCKALQAHLQKLQTDADKALDEWQNSIKERELSEKRRVAPGWLDRTEKILQPEKSAAASPPAQQPTEVEARNPAPAPAPDDENELDRAFGSMKMR